MVAEVVISLLEISKHILRKRIIEIVWYDERTCGETEGTRPADGFDRPNLGDRPIPIHDHERLAFNHPMQKALGVSLYFFHTDVHEHRECNK